MKYVVSYMKNPELYQEAFVAWGSLYDVGYDWFSIDELIDGVSIFNTRKKAEAYAREVLREVFFDELYVLKLNPKNETLSYISTVN